MTRIICVGHAALDRIYRIETFPAGPTKIRALEHIETGGGMAANAAAAIARLGGEAELWSRVGDDDNGVRIRRMLMAFGVDARYVQSFEDNRSSTSVILVDDRGERLVEPGRVLEVSDAHPEMVDDAGDARGPVVDDGLEAIAGRVEDEGAVVVAPVLGARAG